MKNQARAEIILTFLVSGKQFFTADFLLKSPKVGFFYPPSGNLGNLGGLKVHTCAFVIFGLLTRWLAGSEWVMGSKMGSRMAWIARPGRKSGLMLRKLGKKGATALFIITGATQQAQRCPASRSGGEIKPLWEFFCSHRSYSALSNICIWHIVFAFGSKREISIGAPVFFTLPLPPD